jgi:hypothetical protein
MGSAASQDGSGRERYFWLPCGRNPRRERLTIYGQQMTNPRHLFLPVWLRPGL